MRAAQFIASMITPPTILVTILVAILAPTTSWSEDAYQFSGSTVKPEFKKSIEFKNPSDAEKEKTFDPVKEVENKSLYTAPVGYPKTDLYFSYNPGIDGFTDTLSSARTYNYGGTNLTGLSLGVIYNPTIENYLTLDATYESISIPAFSDTGAGLLVSSSNAQMLDIAAGFNFCQVYESTYHRLCPGVELDYDSFPTLSFPNNSNSSINLQTIHDMSLGLNLAYTSHLGQSFQFISKIGYNYGLGVGQSSNLKTTKDQKVIGRVGFERPLSANWYWSVIFGIDYRTANLQSAQDTWKIEALEYNARIGFRYEL